MIIKPVASPKPITAFFIHLQSVKNREANKLRKFTKRTKIDFLLSNLCLIYEVFELSFVPDYVVSGSGDRNIGLDKGVETWVLKIRKKRITSSKKLVIKKGKSFLK